jgi:hypothetical protein
MAAEIEDCRIIVITIKIRVKIDVITETHLDQIRATITSKLATLIRIVFSRTSCSRQVNSRRAPPDLFLSLWAITSDNQKSTEF